MSTPLLYQDEHILVISKPAGLPSLRLTQDDGKPTAIDLALALCPELARPEFDPRECGLLHRLDPSTSGALAFAKTPESFSFYRELWSQDQVQKIYRARVFYPTVELPQAPFEITTPIAHHKKTSKRMFVVPETAGEIFLRNLKGDPRNARTQVLEITPVLDSPLSNRLADVTTRIWTGVRHQIRVHLSSIGLFVLGDPIYHPKEHEAKAPSVERLYLHSWKLVLPERSGGKRIEIVAPLEW